MSDFKAVIKDLQEKIAATITEEGDLLADMASLMDRRDKLKAALESIQGIEGKPAAAAKPRPKKLPPPAVDKGAAKFPTRTCPSCKKLADGFKNCAGCGEELCTARCIYGRSSKCEPCRHERPKTVIKNRGQGKNGITIKKAAPAPKTSEPTSGEPKKCEGCGQQAKDFKPCVSCGADYCTDKCLAKVKECPACLARG